MLDDDTPLPAGEHAGVLNQRFAGDGHQAGRGGGAPACPQLRRGGALHRPPLRRPEWPRPVQHHRLRSAPPPPGRHIPDPRLGLWPTSSSCIDFSSPAALFPPPSGLHQPPKVFIGRFGAVNQPNVFQSAAFWPPDRIFFPPWIVKEGPEPSLPVGVRPRLRVQVDARQRLHLRRGDPLHRGGADRRPGQPAAPQPPGASCIRNLPPPQTPWSAVGHGSPYPPPMPKPSRRAKFSVVQLPSFLFLF